MDCEREIGFLVDSIKRFVTPIAKGVVIGLSGGIDSAVVAALCVRALGSESVHCVIMPCESNLQDSSDANAVAEAIGIKCSGLNLGAPYYACMNLLEGGNVGNLTQANVKSRLRMVLLYAIANEKNYLVAGTGNKSEIMIGYFTKYGDGGIDFEPIGDYYKTEVLELAKELGIPQQVIDKKPSAGLWEGQTDEGEIGMTYHELDTMLMGNKLKSLRVEDLIRNSEHKRNVPPCFERRQT